VGDLSGKFGLLGTSSTSDMATYTDTVASILYDSAAGSRGSMWIVGRSIVIHDADGSRWSCANIGEAGASANVVFDGPDVTGAIELFQPDAGYLNYSYAYGTGSHHATSVTVSLAGLRTSPGNKWHVHVDPVVTYGDCSAAATAGHYDPLTPVTVPQNLSFGMCRQDCGKDCEKNCEIGDLSGKFGYLNGAPCASDPGAPCHFAGTGEGYVLDENLPLYADYSVLGRSIVIHDTDGSRWACATIQTNPTYIYTSPLPPPSPPPPPPPPADDGAPATNVFEATMTVAGSESDYDDAKVAGLKSKFEEATGTTGGVVTVDGTAEASSVTITYTVSGLDGAQADAAVASADNSGAFDDAAAAEAFFGDYLAGDVQATPSYQVVAAAPASGGVSMAAVGGGVAAAVVVLCCIVGICLVMRRRARRSPARPAAVARPQAEKRTANEGYQMAIKEHKDLKANQA
jgi:hypothetical protein